jgi:hypothetical protein
MYYNVQSDIAVILVFWLNGGLRLSESYNLNST